jgi:hypothetical protein
MNKGIIKEQKRALQAAGYVVSQVKPGVWSVRGPEKFIEMWLADCLYRPGYSSGKPMKYDPDEVAALVLSRIAPFEVDSEEIKEAKEMWKSGLTRLTVCYPQAFCLH